MNRAAMERWIGYSILALVLAIIIWPTLAFGGVRASEFVIVQWMFTAALALGVARFWVAPTFRFLLPPSVWATVPLVCYAVWRYREADIEYAARHEFILMLLMVLLFVTLISHLYGQLECRIVTGSLVFLAMVVSMYGIYHWISGSGTVWGLPRPGDGNRASGSFISPNHLAGFLEMSFPLAIVFTVFRGNRILVRVLFGYASLVILVGIAATGSRAGWLSTAVAVTLLCALLLRTRKSLWIALGLIVVVAGTGRFLYSKMLQARMHDIRGQLITDDIRFGIWAASWKMWKDHPWFGVGPAHFDYRYRQYRQPHWSAQPRPGNSHNDYLNTLADWGLVGLSLMLLPVGITLFGAVRSWRYLRRSGERFGNRAAMVIGCCVGLAALLVHSFFDFNMHIPANALVAGVLMSVTTAHWRFATQRYWLRARWPIQVLATIVAGAAIVYLARESLVETRQVRALRVAERMPVASMERIATLKSAFAVDSRNGDLAYEVAEQLRLRASAGRDDYKTLASEANDWFGRAQKLNRWNPRAFTGAGMCLDWLERSDEAEASFRKALELDPNHWFTRGMMGWHYFQVENYEQVQNWMNRSLEVEASHNTLAISYRALAQKMIADQNLRKLRSL